MTVNEAIKILINIAESGDGEEELVVYVKKEKKYDSADSITIVDEIYHATLGHSDRVQVHVS